MPTPPIFRKIEQQLAEMRKAEPPENGYANYKAFRGDIHIIPVYPFREQFLLQLIDLAHHCHTSGVRYNRVDMFETLYRYYRRSSPEGFIKLPEEAVNKLFGIFEKEDLVKGRVRVVLNYLLKSQRLNDEQLRFLVKNAFKSELVLNRVLQYPFASDIVFNWVKYHFEDSRLSLRRMEVTSWLMDERRYATPPISLLYKDLHLSIYLMDESEMYSCVRILKEQGIWDMVAAEPGYEIRSANTKFISLRGEDVYESLSDESVGYEYIGNLAFCALQQTGYYYSEKGFLEPVDLYQSRITTWAIAYSRLDVKIKVNMLKHEYREELTNSYLHIARRLKSVELLEWLLKVCQKHKRK